MPILVHTGDPSSDPHTMQRVTLGTSDLSVTRICLGTMTFGEQVNEVDAHAILDRSLERGVDFIDTAEMYSVPPKAETYGATEAIIGRWFARRPGARRKLVLASKVAGPARGMGWVRGGAGLPREPEAPADRRDRSLPDPLAEPQRTVVRHPVLRPGQ
jgi:aryl-alcohol dehydrogenase-like predicted oxidoreductase